MVQSPCAYVFDVPSHCIWEATRAKVIIDLRSVDLKPDID